MPRLRKPLGLSEADVNQYDQQGNPTTIKPTVNQDAWMSGEGTDIETEEKEQLANPKEVKSMSTSHDEGDEGEEGRTIKG